LKNKVKIFISIFCFEKNILAMFSLILVVLNTTSVQSQFNENYDSLFSVYNSSNLTDDTVRVNLLYRLAAATSLYGVKSYNSKENEIKEANHYCFEAFRLSLKINYEKGGKLFYTTLALINNQKTDLPVLGLTDFDDITNEKFKEFRNYRNRKHFGSLDIYLKAFDDIEGIKSDKQVYLIDYWIGLIYFDWFNYKKAIKHFEKAAKSDGIKFDSIALSDVYQFTAASHFYNGSYDSAIFFFKRSLQILDGRSFKEKTGICLINMGEVYCKKSDFLSASSYFKSSLNQFSLSVDSTYIAYVLNEIGGTSLKLRNFELARGTILKSMNISIHLTDKNILEKTLMNLSGFYAAKGDFENAFRYKVKQHQIKNSLLIDEITSFFTYYEDNWQNAIGREISNKESEALKRSNTTYELNKSRLLLVVMGLIIFSVIVVSFYTLRLYQLKQKANTYLIELNRSKEKLLSIISHDVRGPIIGFIDLLEPLKQQIDNLSTGQISRHIEQIIDLSQSIKLLIDNLLEWTRTQQGLIVYQPEDFALFEVVNPALDMYRQIARYKDITLKCNVQEHVEIYADRNMIHLIIRNLLNNAVKFTRAGGFITIETRKEIGQIVISVANTGIGMSKELMSRFFSKEKMTDGLGTDRNSSGLGLILCKEYVEKCGGKIWAESDEKDTGSTFFFTVKSASNYE
jgi:signal transduction histidine kinase